MGTNVRNDPYEVLREALKAHHDANFSLATSLYRELLEAEPNNAEVLGAYGQLEAQKRNFSEAKSILTEALRLKPNQQGTRINLALVQQELGENEEAYHLLNKEFFNTSDTKLIGLILACLNNMNDFEQAVKLGEKYQSKLKLDPIFLNNLGVAYKYRGETERALELFLQALVQAENKTEPMRNLGIIIGNIPTLTPKEVRLFEINVQKFPNIPELWAIFSRVQKKREYYVDALACIDKALSLPNRITADLLTEKGKLLFSMRRYKKALEVFEFLVGQNENKKEALLGIGACYEELGLSGQAINVLESYIEKNPKSADGYDNLGVSYESKGRYEDATACYEKAILLDPLNPNPKIHLSVLNLKLKNFERGYSLYSERKNLPSFSVRNNFLSVKISNIIGQTKPGQRILILREQGLGDQIFFSRFLSGLLKKNMLVSVVVDSRLVGILKNFFPQIEFLDKMPSMITEYDSTVWMADIPSLLDDAWKSLDGRCKYLFPSISRSKYYKKEPRGNSNLTIGLSWKSTGSIFSQHKSVDLLSIVSALPNLENIRLINLQHGEVADEISEVEKKIGIKIHRVNTNLKDDLDGLVDLLVQCDAVVTVSNSTAHLCGAIGVRAAVLLPTNKGRLWYWHNDDANSYWYPSLHLFSKDVNQGWDPCMRRISNWVSTLLLSSLNN